TITAAGTVSLSAKDRSTIEATALAAAAGVAVSPSSVSGAVSIGVGTALNTIGNQTRALISGIDVTTTSGDVTLTAESQAEIDAFALAASASFSGSGGSAAITVAAAVSYAENHISNSTEALIEGNVTVSAPGAITLQALDQS